MSNAARTSPGLESSRIPQSYAERPRVVEEPSEGSSDHIINTPPTDQTWKPIAIPQDYSPLNARPFILEDGCLYFILVFNLLALAGTVLLLALSDQKRQYHTTFVNTYTVVRYLPTVVGTITTILGRSVTYAYSRLDPYISMADNAGNGKFYGGSFRNTIGSCFLPPLGSLRSPVPWRNILRTVLLYNNAFLTVVTGLKAGFLSCAEENNGWVVTVHPITTVALVAVYLVNQAVMVWIYCRLATRRTGLKWDPTTIADQLALFHNSDALLDLGVLEDTENAHLRKHSGKWRLPSKRFRPLPMSRFRLGYWEKGSGRNKSTSYGIDLVHNTSVKQRTRRDPIHEEDKIGRQLQPLYQDHCTNDSHQPFCCCQQQCSSSRNPYQQSSVYTYGSIIVWSGFIAAALIACCIGLARKVEKTGFSIKNDWYLGFRHLDGGNSTTPYLPSGTVNVTSSPHGTKFIEEIGSFKADAATDLALYIFVFRNVLVYFASLFAMGVMERIDLGTRFSQPFANMYRKDATVSETLLLDYLWGIPGAVTVEALKKGHWKVAWISFLNLLSPIFPVLVGGLFVMTNTGPRIVFKVDESSFYCVFAFLVVYAITLPMMWPLQNRKLPRYCASIVDVMLLFWASKVMTDPALDISGKNVEKKHLESKLLLKELERERFQLGLFTGADGKKHFGVDYKEIEGNGRRRVHVKNVRRIQKDGQGYILDEETN
ncbi:hypothetical protein BCR34DRAFT_53491 [Clohesyomyces aquaticus]|uniref:Uncharacterized protein n=1 Tax=Clohesyomyces aquaticus TaxID=1231657 RepID=A0A1Y1Z3Y1_9PLEO|nr:hypothetical protein BCR34DRAFT_53491 [Clohesyomyces aquaticus]